MHRCTRHAQTDCKDIHRYGYNKQTIQTKLPKTRMQSDSWYPSKEWENAQNITNIFSCISFSCSQLNKYQKEGTESPNFGGGWLTRNTIKVCYTLQPVVHCLYSVNTMSESKQVFPTQSELLHDNPTTMSWEILMTIKPSSPAFTWNSKTAGLVPLQVRGPSYSNKMLTLDIHL